MHTTPTLLFAALLALPAAADAASFSRQVPVGGGDRVGISNVAGSVTITTWNRREVDVQGELGNGVERVAVTTGSNGVDIRVLLKRRAARDADAHLTIRVPADVRLEVSNVSASLNVSGVQGRAHLKTVSGAIRATMQGSDLDATSVSGRIEISGGQARSRMRASTVSGAVDILQGAGDLEVRSTSGRLEVALASAERVRLSTVSGSITVRGTLGEHGSMDLETVSGRVKVATPTTNLRYEASSYSGRVSACFSGESQWTSGRGRMRLEGVRGNGGMLVVAKSHSGSVEICDR
jgi:DUF4097 and DUF4098 domain-containing protein YvlB